MWIGFLLAFPFYIFPPGNPQPSDYFMAGFIVLKILLGQFRIPVKSIKPIRIFIYFLIYISIVNFILFLFYIGHRFDGLPFYIIISFYLFNFLVFTLAFNLYNKYGVRFLEVCLYGMVLSVLLQISLYNYGEVFWGLRDMFFFKNPNQLGYYSLLSLCIFLILQRRIFIPAVFTLFMFITCFFMAFTSLSMAAMYSIVLVLPVFLLDKGILTGRGILYISIIIAGAIIILTQTSQGSGLIDRLEYRFTEKSTRYDPSVTFADERGYDRIIANPEYIILGAGEGGYERFRSTSFIGSHEIHSSFGTIVFSYGIPGVILVLLLIYQSLKGHSVYTIFYAIPIFAYGLAHMGLRFTLFWIAIAILTLTKIYEKQLRSELIPEFKKDLNVAVAENE